MAHIVRAIKSPVVVGSIIFVVFELGLERIYLLHLFGQVVQFQIWKLFSDKFDTFFIAAISWTGLDSFGYHDGKGLSIGLVEK